MSLTPIKMDNKTIISLLGYGALQPISISDMDCQGVIELLKMVPTSELDSPHREMAVGKLISAFATKIPSMKQLPAAMFLDFMMALGKAAPGLEPYFTLMIHKIKEDRSVAKKTESRRGGGSH